MVHIRYAGRSYDLGANINMLSLSRVDSYLPTLPVFSTVPLRNTPVSCLPA